MYLSTVLCNSISGLVIQRLGFAYVYIIGLAVAGAGLAYLVSPLDFLPGLLFGPVGMIDDLVVVALSLSAILNHTHPDVVRSHWPGQGDVLLVIQRVTGWVEESVVGRNFARLIGLWPG